MVPRGGGNAEPGKYRLARMPYQEAALDDVLDPDATEVCWLWASQIGKTACIVIVVLYHIHQKPSAILVVYPTVDSGKSWVKQKFVPAVEETPAMRGIIKTHRSRDGGNTTLMKQFPGGFIQITGANSPSSLRQRSVRVLVMDEIDAMKPNAEGDPIAQAEKRAETFHDAVKLFSSTPTIPGSAIDAKWDKSDKCYWFCACPNCGTEQHLKWEQMRWPEDDPAAATYECEACKAHWTDQQRIASILAGRWKATAPFKGTRGRHISGLYRLIGKKRGHRSYLHEFVVEYLKAKAKGAFGVMVWTNTFLALPYVEASGKIESDPLLLRREKYTTAPRGVVLVVAGCDVQGNRIELECVGYGPDGETWGLGYKVIYGNTLQPAVWKELDEYLLNWSIKCDDGRTLKIYTAAIDYGGMAGVQQVVLKWVKPRQGRRIHAVKGLSTYGSPLVGGISMRNRWRVPVHMIGTDAAKTTIYGRLQLTLGEPGCAHYTDAEGFGYDKNYFSMLTAEETRIEIKKGVPRRVWVQVRDRNEALDIRVYAEAAIQILSPNWKAWAKKLSQTKPIETTPEGESIPATEPPKDQPKPPPQAPKKKPPARVRGSGWFGGFGL